VTPDAEFVTAIAAMQNALGLTELHLTGGEPTLHPRLADIVRLGTNLGMRVCLTSNGERGAAVLEECANAGLHHVNFSVFGTTAEELAQVQDARYANLRRAKKKIEALQESIFLAQRLEIPVSANIVVPSMRTCPEFADSWSNTCHRLRCVC
jgi:cyclic pyranopterin phosphate synthase